MINWRIINKYLNENKNYRYKCLDPQEALMYRWGRVSTSEVERKWACWQYRWNRAEHGCEKGKDRGREGINVLVREKVREEERKIGWMYVSVCMCLYMCLCYASLCMCLYMCLCVCICVYVYVCVSARVYVSMCVNMRKEEGMKKECWRKGRLEDWLKNKKYDEKKLGGIKHRMYMKALRLHSPSRRRWKGKKLVNSTGRKKCMVEVRREERMIKKRKKTLQFNKNRFFHSSWILINITFE